MWMRSCAMCEALLKKLRWGDSIRCQCGWEWRASLNLWQVYLGKRTDN
jgi:hypothetical protein